MHVTIPLDKMSATEKLQVIEEIWADLSRVPEDVPSPAWHADVLRAREQRITDGRSRFREANGDTQIVGQARGEREIQPVPLVARREVRPKGGGEDLIGRHEWRRNMAFSIGHEREGGEEREFDRSGAESGVALRS